MKNQKNQNSTAYAWEWPAVMGVFLMVMGALIIGIPTAATLSMSWLMGLVFVVSGVAQLIHAFRFTQSHGALSRFLLAALSLIAGVIALRNPVAGAMGITLVLAFYFLLSAVVRGAHAFETRKVTGRGWLVFSSIVSLCLGVYLLVTFPMSSLVVPGTLLGVDLIFYGVSLTVISGRLRRGGLSLESTELRRVA